MVLTILELVLLPFIPATIACIIFIISLKRQLASVIELEKTPENSIAVFLRDIDKYGWTWMRLDPGEHYYRSPKE